MGGVGKPAPPPGDRRRITSLPRKIPQLPKPSNAAKDRGSTGAQGSPTCHSMKPHRVDGAVAHDLLQRRLPGRCGRRRLFLLRNTPCTRIGRVPHRGEGDPRQPESHQDHRKRHNVCVRKPIPEKAHRHLVEAGDQAQLLSVPPCPRQGKRHQQSTPDDEQHTGQTHGTPVAH